MLKSERSMVLLSTNMFYHNLLDWLQGCAARNVHNFTEEQVKSMADHWEPTPLLYLKLDVSVWTGKSWTSDQLTNILSSN